MTSQNNATKATSANEATNANIGDQPQNNPLYHSLPVDGCSRASTLADVLDISKATIWAWTKNGKFPQPMRLSSTVTVWRNSDVLAWLDEKAKQASLPPVDYLHLAKSASQSANDNSFDNGVA